MVGNDEYYFCSLNFLNVGMLRYFIILSAIVGYELSLTYYMIYGTKF